MTNNTITDITPISGLTNLTSLDLSNNPNINIYNKQTEVCSLPNKENLLELNISNTNNSDISFVSQVPNLKVFKASNNGIGSTVELTYLTSIETLNLSGNAAIKSIDDILSLYSLKELDLSSTGITTLLHSKSGEDEDANGIWLLENLENLNVENNELESIDPILNTYVDEMVVNIGDKDIVIEYDRAFLENLKQLNFNYTGQSNIDFETLILLKNLTHLSMRGNGISKLDEDITELKKLEYINLSDNLLTDINKFVKYITEERVFIDENGKQYTKDVEIPQYLTATKIELAHNKIKDISLLWGFDHDIKYLDLSENAVYDIEVLDSGKFSLSDGLKLQRQGCGWDKPIYHMLVKDKEVSVDQYIILPTLFQNSKKSGSKLYSENANFEVFNIELNNDEAYQVPGYYNVIIDYQKTKDDVLKVTLHGGCADGSTLYFKISTDKYSTDSSVFNDPNLISAITNEINEMGYSAKNALKIINVYRYVFDEIEELYLDGFQITDIMGLASFEKLKNLYLSNNNISSINELRENINLKELYLSNNQNLKDVTPIENMVNLTKLDLANTGLTNINSLNKLIQNMYNKNKKTYPLKYLSLSSNNIDSIDGIEVLKSLEELHISNINIKDISKISSLTSLKTLNVSGNRIEDLETLRSLKNLRYLYINNNNIEDIEPISKIALSTLEFSGNRVKDVTLLTQSYSSLIMDSNMIGDVSCFDYMSYDNFSVANQKLTHTVQQWETGDITIELPPLLLLSQQTGSKVYSAKEFILTNCKLTEDKNSVIVNVEELKNQKIATVKINGGNAQNTTFSIAEPLEGIIEYTPSNETPTNQDITAKITFNRDNVTITNNDGKDTYIFTENGDFTFEYMDSNGFEGVTTAVITNIDKTPPVGTVTQEIVNKEVVVKIELSEPITAIDGWTVSEDGLNITKVYTVDANETITITDSVGNTTLIEIIVEIDTTPPTVTGVENDKLYGQAVTPIIEDKNLDTIKLFKDEIEVIDYEAGTAIIDSGKYVLTVTDKFENITTVSFEIDVSGMIISTSNQIIVKEKEIVGEETKPVIRIATPKTTIGQIRESLKSEMTYDILNDSGNTTSANRRQIGTGYQLRMTSGKLYTIIVYGDITGDGEISISELAVASRIASNPETEIDNLKFMAMDLSGDGQITVPDLAALSRLRNTY